MYKVVISPSANADLFNALKYIAFELENPQSNVAPPGGTPCETPVSLDIAP